MLNKITTGSLDGVPMILYNQNPYVGNKKLDYPSDNIAGAKYTIFKNSETLLPWQSLTGKITNQPDNYNVGYQYQPGIYHKI